MSKVCAIVITLDEEPRIEECLSHLRPHVDHIVLVDNGSKDRTVEIAKKHADTINVRPDLKRQDDLYNHAKRLAPKNCGWILVCDADERFDVGFLRNIKQYAEAAEEGGAGCVRLPRVNLPNAINFPDYQVRLFRNSRDIVIRGHPHWVAYLEPLGLPLDQADQEEREEKLYVVTLDDFPIIHLPRRTDIHREWWE